MSTPKTDAKKTMRTKQDAECEALIVGHLALVKQILNRIAVRLPPHVDRDDLLEAGMIGLINAAHRFDVTREVKFSTYAVTRIRGAILDALRAEDWLPRSARNEITRIDKARNTLEHSQNGPVGSHEISRHLQMPKEKVERLRRMATTNGFHSLDEVPSGVIDHHNNALRSGFDTYTLPEDRAILGEQKEILADVVRSLPEREQLVISLYYFEQLNLREIAEVLEVTNSRVCQIHRSALKRMQRAMRQSERCELAAAV
jgi:RNA polymerase sigma factor FliA